LLDQPSFAYRWNRKSTNNQDYFVSGNIFGIGEYHSTSGVAHIAGTRIPQQKEECKHETRRVPTVMQQLVFLVAIAVISSSTVAFWAGGSA
jgi:hypothetical protein